MEFSRKPSDDYYTAMKKSLLPAFHTLIFPSVIALLCLAVAFAGMEIQTMLRYQREAIGSGELLSLIHI
jgi:hypothetical protein